MFVKAVNKMNPKPKFVMFTGDLVHGLPGKFHTTTQTYIKPPSQKEPPDDVTNRRMPNTRRKYRPVG
jgi:hypothetical protein